MSLQLLYIHGGQSFSNYAAFLEQLRTCEIRDPLGEKPVRWSEKLRDELGEEWDVYMPSMPNKQNAKYEEWKIWFERYCEFLSDGAYLIGWSQGGFFLTKYLIENPAPVAIARLYLIAAPFEADDFGGEDGGDFAFDTSRVGELAEKVSNITVVHSTDDPVVPVTHAQKYAASLPTAEFVQFQDRNHFLQESFPELIAHIKKNVV